MITTASDIRIAVFGCGSIGRRHIKNARELGYAVVAAFDPMSSPTAEVPMTRSASEAFDSQPNVALVCSPPDSHIELAMMAVERGCDVFVEKPLSNCTDGIDRLIDVAESRRAVSMVGCNMRFHPGPMTVKRLIEEGAIGRVLSARIQSGSYLPAWRPSSDYRKSYSASAEHGGGAVLDCIHEVDLAIWYLGPCEVIAASVQPATSIGLDVDGLAEILMRHESGAISSVHLNFVQRDYRRGCQIIGERGTLYWDFEEPLVKINTGGGSEPIHLPAWQINDMYVSELRHFFDCVQRRTPTVNPVRAGRDTLRIALDARRKGMAA